MYIKCKLSGVTKNKRKPHSEQILWLLTLIISKKSSPLMDEFCENLEVNSYPDFYQEACTVDSRLNHSRAMQHVCILRLLGLYDVLSDNYLKKLLQ